MALVQEKEPPEYEGQAVDIKQGGGEQEEVNDARCFAFIEQTKNSEIKGQEAFSCVANRLYEMQGEPQASGAG